MTDLIRRVASGQRGVTLLELLTAITLAGIVATAVTVTTLQVFAMNTRASNHMLAVREVQQVGDQISRDLLQITEIHTADDPDTPEYEVLTMRWLMWDVEHSGKWSKVVYTWNEVDGELARRWYIGSDVAGYAILANHITEFEVDLLRFDAEGIVSFRLTSTVGSGSPYEQSQPRLGEVTSRLRS